MDAWLMFGGDYFWNFALYFNLVLKRKRILEVGSEWKRRMGASSPIIE